MKLNKSNKISIRVVLLFTVAIFSTFIGDCLHEFFNDFYCDGATKFSSETWTYYECNYGTFGSHYKTWHWGYRHWLYFAMSCSLFVIQLVGIIHISIEE